MQNKNLITRKVSNDNNDNDDHDHDYDINDNNDNDNGYDDDNVNITNLYYIFSGKFHLTQAEDDFLLFTDSNRQNIYKMYLSGGDHIRINYNSHINPIAVGYDPIEQHVFWTERANAEHGHKYIYRHKITTGHTVRYNLPRGRYL